MNRKFTLRVLRLPDWPARDRDAWHAACVMKGFFEDSGPLARFDPVRRRVLEAAFGRWLAFLALHRPELNWDSGCELLDAENIGLFVDLLSAQISPKSVATYLEDLRIVAYALSPMRSFPDLDRITAYLKTTARPIRNKRSLVVPARDLVSLGFELVDTAPGTGSPLCEACRYRDGLMIALLASSPIRLGNFAMIEIDRHLIRTASGFRLVFPCAEVKNGRPIDCPVWEELNGPMSRYLSHLRPILVARRGRHWRGDPGSVLWISEHGTAMKRVTIWNHITERTRERFGTSVNPHLFRDCAATSVAIELPEQVGIIRPVLGHTNTTTGQKYYNHAKSIEAARKFQRTVETLKEPPP